MTFGYHEANALPDATDTTTALEYLWAARVLMIKAKNQYIDQGNLTAIDNIDAAWEALRKTTSTEILD